MKSGMCFLFRFDFSFLRVEISPYLFEVNEQQSKDDMMRQPDVDAAPGIV